MKKSHSAKSYLLRTVVCAACLTYGASAKAQWTLRQCCDYAVEHNLDIKQRENQVREQELELSTARNSRLPNLSASASQGFNFGRSLTSENTYTNTNTNSTSFNLGTSVPLFTGFNIPNTIKLNKLNLEAVTADLEKAKNDIQMRVAESYVQILYDMEIADVAHRQIAIDSAQTARLEAFVRNGKASEAELSQQKATLANSRLTATQADNETRLAILTLTQLLELSTPEGFSIVRPDVTGQTSQSYLTGITPDQIYGEALAVKPEIQSQELRLRSAEHTIKIAQSALYPSLSLSAGIGSNYYKTSGYAADNFGKQLSNNFSQYVGLNLNVPIFNRFSTRNNIRKARIAQENQQLLYDNTKKTLYKEIQQVYYNSLNAIAKESSSIEAVKSSKDAFTLMQAKYENGKATLTEFNEAKNNYLKAESDLVQARYQNLYQQALVEFYRGRQLNF